MVAKLVVESLKRAAANAYTNRPVLRVQQATEGEHGPPRVANETRPKNVALLYCRKD